MSRSDEIASRPTITPSGNASAAAWKAHADALEKKHRDLADSENNKWTGTSFKGSSYDTMLNQVLPQQLQGARSTAAQKSRIESGKTQMQGGKEVRVPSYKKGGVVRKTGIILAHKGERIVSAKERKNLRKIGRR